MIRMSTSQYQRLFISCATLLLVGAGCTRDAAETPVALAPAPLAQTSTSLLPVSLPPQPSLPQPQSIMPSPSQPSLQPPPKAPFIFKSSAFASGAVIPVKYTCDGADTNPSLSWSGAPEATKSFTLIVDDPDAVPVIGHVADHWVLWNIPSSAASIAEGSVPAGASQGQSYSAQKYQGPCPPSGTTHRYTFKLYALDIERLNLPSSTSGKSLEAAMQGHIIKKAELTGRYTAK